MTMNETVKNTIDALKRNRMNAVYAEDKAAVVQTVREMLFPGCTISSGGSVSLEESGVKALITASEYNYLDRLRPGITKEEQLEVYKNVIGCDFYFCSANAVTENGELVNVDGNCNRIAALAFGPKKVIVIAGINKLVSDVSEGLLRVKQIAAPKNAVRLKIDTPCSRLGHCVSLETDSSPDFTAGCCSDNRICASYLITARQRLPGRITVILCGEPLGY